MAFRKLIGQIHLWLGLSSGLVVFIISVTGCLYAFQAEVGDLTQPYRFVEPQQKTLLSPSQLKTIAQQQLPGKKVHSVQYGRERNAAQVAFYNFEPAYYYLVYLN